ncbi:hypothetical protein V6N13_114328 [Hibiscus sabdariffa]|uniref:UmuC domain-containing protein n=1 Tax=Hibiscus sabdariffa TaxID=183260 RepID=A0ABR2U1R7_9ROSI
MASLLNPSTAISFQHKWSKESNLINYEARKFGVKRSMRGVEAKEVCTQIQLVQVPVARGKVDLNGYQNAGSELFEIW